MAALSRAPSGGLTVPTEFTYRRRVEFADTDTANVAHFTALFRYMEEAEHAFYRSLGATAYDWSEEGVSGMPRVAAALEFLRSVRYGDELEIRLVVSEVRTRSIRYEVTFLAEEGGETFEIATGSMTVVSAARRHGERAWSAVELPAVLRDRIESAPTT